MIDFISQPWPWYVAGPLIALVMFSLLFFGNSFGISSNFRTLCSLFGAGNRCEYFDFDWKSQRWNMVFVVGLLVGGWIANQFLASPSGVGISAQTTDELERYGMAPVGNELAPLVIFSWTSLLTWKGFIMLVLGGFLVGFGTRYAGGCTSGHAISGLSDLQPASLLAVVGFFIGGLLVTHLVLPHLLTL
ncbi:MAG: YeeE/YedE thiosulfate transporter family protein [Bacteroidota bacterium]